MRATLASLALVLMAWCAPALAQTAVNPEGIQIGLSTDVVYIRADFTGADLTIFGALDNLSYPSVYARINPCASLKPDMPITVIPNAGHWVQYEAAPAVDLLLLDFFG